MGKSYNKDDIKLLSPISRGNEIGTINNREEGIRMETLPEINPFNLPENYDNRTFGYGKNIYLNNITIDNLEKVLYIFKGIPQYEGFIFCVCQLKDKRYLAWSTPIINSTIIIDFDIYVSDSLENLASFEFKKNGKILKGYCK